MDPHNLVTDRVPGQPSIMQTQSMRRRPDRGARGYLEYESGVLDVAPMGINEISLYNANAKESALLRLPPELRNVIWEYALSDHALQFCPCTPEQGAKLFDAFPLLRTCRQIYTETALLPYILNDFMFITRHDKKHANFGFMKHIQNVKVLLDDSFWDYIPFPILPRRSLRRIELRIEWEKSHVSQVIKLVECVKKHFGVRDVTVNYEQVTRYGSELKVAMARRIPRGRRVHREALLRNAIAIFDSHMEKTKDRAG